MITVVSNINVHSIGGLAAYQRSLGNCLGRSKIADVAFVCFSSSDIHGQSSLDTSNCTVRYIPKSWYYVICRQLYLRCASRAFLRGFAIWLASRSISRSWLHRLVGDASVVHYVGTGWDMLGFAFLAEAQRMNCPFTVCPAVHPNSWGDDFVDFALYERSQTVFCLSASEHGHLQKKGLSGPILEICRLPPMCSSRGNGEALRRDLAIASSPAVLFIGRRDEGKGYFSLLLAWEQVIQRLPDAVLLLSGPADRSGMGHCVIQQRNLRDLGIADETTKADALAACDVFCLPSAHESFGIVYLEAWSYGKPVICGTAPACRELIRHGETGLHSSQDVKQLADSLIRLLSNPSEAQRLGLNGKAEQEKNYTEQSMVDAHLKVWKSLTAA